MSKSTRDKYASEIYERRKENKRTATRRREDPKPAKSLPVWRWLVYLAALPVLVVLLQRCLG